MELKDRYPGDTTKSENRFSFRLGRYLMILRKDTNKTSHEENAVPSRQIVGSRKITAGIDSVLVFISGNKQTTLNHAIITITIITITLLIVCYYYTIIISTTDNLILLLFTSCFISLKLLLTPFCFSYCFKFSRDHNEDKAFACCVLSSPYSFCF